MENENIPTWEKNMYQVEKLVDDLYNYALICAMEIAKLNGKNRELVSTANYIKSTSESARNLLIRYKIEPLAILGPINYWDSGAPVGRDKLEKVNKISVAIQDSMLSANGISENNVLKDQYPSIMLAWTSIWEATVLQGIVEAYKSDASALLICLEEIRKTALELKAIFKADDENLRHNWHDGIRIETKKMHINSKKSEYLSFNLGGYEVLEELSYIVKILPFKDVHEFIVKLINGEITSPQDQMENWKKIEAYLDLYRICNLQQPSDLDDMKILILKIPAGDYKLNCAYKYLAIAVDFVNYPLLTATGDEQISTNQQIKSEYIRGCWHTKNYLAGADDKTSELLFLDWQKLLADHEASNKQPEFEDLLNLSDIEIQSILKKCELSDLLFALKGCSPTLKHKIEDNLSEKVKLQIKEEFDKTEAVPIHEVEKAQDKITKLAFSK